MILNFSWMEIFEKALSGIISGVFLILIGLILFKWIRKKQTLAEAKIQIDLKLKYIVNEYRRMKTKYTKELHKNSMSYQVEQELSDLYGICIETEELCQKYNLPVDSNLKLLMNATYAKKGVLYCNNPVPISNERIPYFKQLNQMELEGIRHNKESFRILYLELFQGYDSEINDLKKNNRFFKKYWKN